MHLSPFFINTSGPWASLFLSFWQKISEKSKEVRSCLWTRCRSGKRQGKNQREIKRMTRKGDSTPSYVDGKANPSDWQWAKSAIHKQRAKIGGKRGWCVLFSFVVQHRSKSVK